MEHPVNLKLDPPESGVSGGVAITEQFSHPLLSSLHASYPILHILKTSKMSILDMREPYNLLLAKGANLRNSLFTA